MPEEAGQVVIVGGGPAGLAAALTLARGGLSDVILLERGARSGAKNVMGGILYTPSLERLVPGIWATDAPLERPVTRRSFSVLTGDSSLDLSFMRGGWASPPHNHSFTVLRGRFDAWLARRAEEAGVTILTGVVAEGLVRDDRGAVTGVRTRVEEGVEPDEGVLGARIVILAEGANAVIAEREGLRPKTLAGEVAVAAKEVLALPEAAIRERFNLGENGGEGREYYGDAAGGMFGSGFVYTNRDTLSVGVAVSVRDLSASGKSPNDLLEHFKAHPAVAPLLEGGETVEYSAHLIPEGGFRRLGTLSAPGLMVAGDGAGLVNVSPFHEGANLAIASGIMAAETALEALASGDVGAESMAAYRGRLEASFVLKDMEKFADLPGFFRDNPQVVARWMPALVDLVGDMLSQSEEPKQALEERALDRFRREVGLLPLLVALWQLRGATKSLYHDSTARLVDYLQRNW